jgi:hypothetical protein
MLISGPPSLCTLLRCSTKKSQTWTLASRCGRLQGGAAEHGAIVASNKSAQSNAAAQQAQNI